MKQAIINVKIDTRDGVKSVGEVNSAIKTTLVSLRDMEEASGAISEKLKGLDVGSEEFKLLSKELIKLNTELKNHELALEALDHEQVASEIKSVVGGLTDMAGGFALIGVSSQSMEKVVQTFAKIEGASKIATGAMEGYQSMMKLSGTITKTLSAWQTTLAAAQLGTGVSAKAAAVGMRVLNAVMNANPVFLLIAGITALAGAMYLFGDSQESAAEKASKLNAELETQMKISQNLSDYEKMLIEGQLKGLELSNEKVRESIQLEIDLLEMKTEKTQQENDKIKALRSSLVQHNKESIQEEFDATVDMFDAEENATKEKYNNLNEQRKNLMKTISSLEDEALTETLDNIDQIGDEMTALSNKLVRFVADRANLINEWKNRAIKIENDRAREEGQIRQKEADEYKKKMLERRKILLDEINDIIARRKSANSELEQIEIEKNDNLMLKEIELQELQYGAERDKIIDGAIKREIAALEERFVKGQISEETFISKRKALYENATDFFIEEEVRLVDALEVQNQKKISDIVRTHENIKNLTALEAQEINAMRIKAENDYQKQLKLFHANNIRDEKQRNEAILQINKDYLDKEIYNLNWAAEAQKKVLFEQYQQDINQTGITAEEKLKIQEQYYLDVANLAQQTELQVMQLQQDAADVTEKQLGEKMNKFGAWVNAISGMISHALQTIQMGFDVAAENDLARRTAQYTQEEEALRASFANREMTEIQFADKMALLEQQKRQEELMAKRRTFKQNKAMNIANTLMQGAQAVVSAFNAGASLGPAGVVMGPLMASFAGAMTAAQVAIISAQKFHAARGGIVPGSPSKMDSVDARLAPGEAVINSESTSMFPQLLSAINMMGGGRPLAPMMEASRSQSMAFANAQSSMRAYVVETDITDSQKKIKRYEQQNTF